MDARGTDDGRRPVLVRLAVALASLALGGSLLLLATLGPDGLAGARPAEPGPAEKMLIAYLRAVYARDYPEAYDLISLEDRRLKTRAEYAREHGTFTGPPLELAQVLAALIRFEDLRTAVEGDRAVVTFRAVLPDANAPEVDEIMLGFDEERLAALRPAERAAIADRLRRMAAAGTLPVVVGDDERWELIREGEHWRLWLNWAGAVVVRFEAAVRAGLPWEFAPVQPVIRAKPGQTLHTYYRVRNRSDRTITAKARHILHPPEETGQLEIIRCFCFLQETLDPGEEKTLPVVFRVSYDIPSSLTELRARYEFYPLDAFPSSDERAG